MIDLARLEKTIEEYKQEAEEALETVAYLQSVLDTLCGVKSKSGESENNIDSDISKGVPPIFMRRCDGLEVSNRIKNALNDVSILYIGDLVTKSRADILSVPLLGKKSINEIKHVLAQIKTPSYPSGLELGMDVPEWRERCRLFRLSKKELLLTPLKKIFPALDLRLMDRDFPPITLVGHIVGRALDYWDFRGSYNILNVDTKRILAWIRDNDFPYKMKIPEWEEWLKEIDTPLPKS